MSNDGVNSSRRTFLIGLTSAIGAALRESYGSNYSHAQPDENFTLLIVHITQVDYLRLAPLPHLRLLYSLDEQGKWQTKAGSP